MLKRGTIGAMAAAALLAACGDADDPAGAKGDQLTREEALVIVDAIAQANVDDHTTVLEGRSTSLAGDSPGRITVEHKSSHPCPVDGRVVIALNATLTYDQEDKSLDYEAEGSLTHEECGLRHEDVTITVDGDPTIAFATRAAFSGGVATEPITETVEGAFLWSTSDGRSGRCVIDLEKVTDLVAKRHTLRGEACGHTIERTITWT
ncbi:MAG: hypothetical protein DIU52_008940 [bacterium]|jgi:hypothetical protein|nr:MAG: hypothetical protein DIU52_00400 [bacterium]